jgi:hypothetical protein
MSASWSDPRLGEFSYDGMQWRTIVDAPAFDRFSYQGRHETHPPSGRYEMVFYVDDMDTTPSQAAADAAARALEHQAALPEAVVRALWDDFTGAGPDSGMWWAGNLEEVAEGFEDLETDPPAGPDDLYPSLGLARIAVRSGGEDETPAAELMFRARFEEEHGVGVLVDGPAVLGLGYQADVSPFGSDG